MPVTFADFSSTFFFFLILFSKLSFSISFFSWICPILPLSSFCFFFLFHPYSSFLLIILHLFCSSCSLHSFLSVLSALSFSSSLCDSDCRWHPSSSLPATPPLALLRSHISLIFREAKCDTRRHTHTHTRACADSMRDRWDHYTETDARCLSLASGGFFFSSFFVCSSRSFASKSDPLSLRKKKKKERMTLVYILLNLSTPIALKAFN